MSRRGKFTEQEFGSDSFLDIIANIVGILIILIVIAGMKVARQPLTVSEPQEVLSNTDIQAAEVASLPKTNPVTTVDTSPLVAPLADDPFVMLDAPTKVNEPPVVNEFAPFDPPVEESDSSDLLEQVHALTLDLENLKFDVAGSEMQLNQLLAEYQSRSSQNMFDSMNTDGMEGEAGRLETSIQKLHTEIASSNDDISSTQAKLASLTDRQKHVTSALRQVSVETQKLREVLDDVQPTEVVDRLQHRVSPVSRAVSNREMHFRLADGKVAHIPLEQLLERLKAQVAQKREVIMKFYRSEGLVGPLGGFRLQYVVERKAVSPLKALQYGQNAFRVMVSKWTVLPAETLQPEPVAEAVQLGSRFRQLLEAAEPGTSMTIWLYPEDFSKFAQLRELGHRLNLRVAARPLPTGTPIAGSPNGSRSASQ